MKARGTGNYENFSSEYNALNFIITNIIKSTVNTCFAVTVTDVDIDNQKVTVKPLIAQIDGDNNKIELPEIFEIPYFRYSAGNMAVKLDPNKNDIGIMIVFKSDSNNIKIGDNSQILPNTFLNYPLYSGVYFGGILNNEPENFIEIKEDNINIEAKANITINCKNVTIQAEENAEITCKTATIKADNKVDIDAMQVAFCGANASQGAVSVGSPCPLTGTHSKGSSKVFAPGI